MVVGFKEPVYELDKADPGSEFFDEEKASIRGKIAAIEIYFDFLIALKRNGV